MSKEELLQTNIDPLLHYFNKLIPLNSEEKRLVTALFKPRLYRKRQYVLQEGDVCNQFIHMFILEQISKPFSVLGNHMKTSGKPFMFLKVDFLS